jgi:hypothetical protein
MNGSWQFNDITRTNSWEDLTEDDWDICREGKRRLTFNYETITVIIEE